MKLTSLSRFARPLYVWVCLEIESDRGSDRMNPPQASWQRCHAAQPSGAEQGTHSLVSRRSAGAGFLGSQVKFDFQHEDPQTMSFTRNFMRTLSQAKHDSLVSNS